MYPHVEITIDAAFEDQSEWQLLKTKRLVTITWSLRTLRKKCTQSV